MGMLLAVILLGNATIASAATPWDLIVRANLEQAEVSLNGKPVVFGTVLDQAARPVSGVEVKISFSDRSATTTTDSEGNFRYEFGEQYMPGTFSVNVFAKLADKKGFAKLTLKIGNESTTFSEIYYSSDKFAGSTTALPNDPYAAIKLKHLKEFIEEQNRIKQKQIDVEAKKLALHEKRSLAQQMLEKALRERPVGAGVFSDAQYERYLATVDPRIKDQISYQLNYTKQLRVEAQHAMKAVLDNGGSLEDARKAYFEKLSVTKEELLDVNDLNNTKNYSKIKTNDDKKINSKKVKGLTVNKNLK
jgi:hypothetical protein